MKRILLTLVLVIPQAHGQWTVYDPAVHHQQILGTAQEMAKFVQVIQKQVDQLRSLEEQVTTLHHYVDLFGDPGQAQPEVIPVLAEELLGAEAGTNLGDLIEAADPVAAMVEEGGGLYQAIGETFTTPAGEERLRTPVLYQAIAASHQATANFLTVSESASRRRVALKARIAEVAQALSEATTDAIVQKLTATLSGLGSALTAIDHEVTQATASALVQDVATRTDQARQEAARTEEGNAQFTEALQRYNATFRLFSAPVAFPTP